MELAATACFMCPHVVNFIAFFMIAMIPRSSKRSKTAEKGHGAS
jgi:hypothetical protein